LPLHQLEGPSQALDSYRAQGGYEALSRVRHSATGADEILSAVAAAHLHGHGGAGFPAARKWELARAADGRPKYVVVNGGEHEPGSRKDRTLLAQVPHLVLEGAALCAHATGASAIYVYVIEDMHDAVANVRAAIDQARAANLLGELDVQVALAPPTYVAGEETAALEVIEGRKAWPRKKPPFPGQAGLFGKPTTVNNVETLAYVPGIVRHGPQWFVPGAMLCTLDETFARPGIVEAPLGLRLRSLVDELGGGTCDGRAVKGIAPAMSSAWLPAAALDTPMTYNDLRKAGSNLGCGGFSLLLEGECAVERALRIAEFFKREQCGQCPPCRMQTNTVAAILEKLRVGEPGEFRAQLVKICEFARGKGNCSLIEMAAAPVLSALTHFGDDFEHHARHGRCR
jgi:NADH-quinone oxidoreductase subunit F